MTSLQTSSDRFAGLNLWLMGQTLLKQNISGGKQDRISDTNPETILIRSNVVLMPCVISECNMPCQLLKSHIEITEETVNTEQCNYYNLAYTG